MCVQEFEVRVQELLVMCVQEFGVHVLPAPIQIVSCSGASFL